MTPFWKGFMDGFWEILRDRRLHAGIMIGCAVVSIADIWSGSAHEWFLQICATYFWILMLVDYAPNLKKRPP